MVNHERKIIFVHIPRTSGSSVEKALGVTYTEVTLNHKHMRASEIKKLVGKNIWNSYYKFSIVRNPFDRVVSLYSMEYNAAIGYKSQKPLSFFLDNYQPAPHEQGLTCADYIDEDLDYVGRFENRSEFIDTVNEVCGTDIDNSFKFDPDKTLRRPYQDYYRSVDNVNKVVTMFKADFAKFGYDENISI